MAKIIRSVVFGVIALGAMAFTTGCADSGSINSVRSGDARITSAAAHSLTITDTAGAPLANAMVMIGMREGVPFPGNVMTTDANGMVVVPEGWTDAQPVTIEAAGFVRTTYFAASAQTSTFAVRKQIVPQKLELKGATNGFGDLKKDGFGDVGMVFPALPRSAVNTLSVSALVSPETDRMSVFGQDFDVPSNVTFPKQTENYVLPITLNKPNYRVYLPYSGAWKVVSTHVRFPFKDTVDDMRGGKSFFDLINKMEFRQGSVQDFTINKSTQSADLAVNKMVYQKTLPFAAPRFEQGFHLLAIALGETGGLYYVTDVKKVDAQQKATLATPKTGSGPALVVAALRRADAPTTGAAVEEITAVTLPANASVAYSFLPNVKAPKVQAGAIALDAPNAVTGVDAVMTYGVLNKIEAVGAGQMKIEQKIAQWDVFAPAWVGAFELPEMSKLPSKPADKFRWEVMFGGQFAGQSVPSVGPAALEQLTHVTRSAVDL